MLRLLILLRPVLLLGLLAAVGLGLLARLILLRLLVAEVRLALHVRLTLHGLAHVVVVAVHLVVAIAFARRRRCLIVGVLLPELLLRRGDQAQIVLGVLEVVLGGDRIAGGLGVARKLQILLGDVVSGAADLHLRAVRLVNPRQWIVMMTAAAAAATAATAVIALVAVPPSHALVLTVSHSSPVADSCLRRFGLSRRSVSPQLEAVSFSPVSVSPAA